MAQGGTGATTLHNALLDPARFGAQYYRRSVAMGAMYMSTPVVLITGALTGIGHATALAFAKEGARLVVSGRRDDAGLALAAELRALGAEAEFIRADVRDENDVQNLVDKTVARFGRL